MCSVCAVGKKKSAFNDQPFAYHQEIELEIATLTNLGSGLGRIPLAGADEPAEGGGWVVMVPFTLPGERVRARVFRNHKNFSEADLVAVLRASPDRVTPRCPLFGRCGGCQYQHLGYASQLVWKQRQVAELLPHLAAVEFPVAVVVGSPREYGYRSKITPHFATPRRWRAAPAAAVADSAVSAAGAGLAPRASAPESTVDIATAESQEDAAAVSSSGEIESRRGGPEDGSLAIGFLRQGTRFEIVDVPQCPIATDAINARLAQVREEVRARVDSYSRGATLLLREASGEVTTEYDAVVTESIGPIPASERVLPGAEAPSSNPGAKSGRSFSPSALRLHFLARDFFQNNPFILPAFTAYVREQAAATGARFLVDAYCGSGLFALAAAPAFERVAGVEISESSVRFARENAAANGIANATFLAGDAASIFAGLDFAPADSVVVIDPPRKGCDRAFLAQLLAFGPRAVVYVSCDPATQMRDLRSFLEAGYALRAVQPFDLFPQTRHLECVLTLVRP